MDDSISTILYIIIAIGYFVFSILRKSKPQNKPSNTPQPPGNEDFEDNSPAQGRQKQRPSFEDLLREFTQEIPGVEETLPQQEEVKETFTSTVQDVVPEPTEQEKSPYSKFQKINFEPALALNKDTEGIKVFKESKTKAKPQQSNLGKLLRKPGGLKQAVILSEVLKTKYF